MISEHSLTEGWIEKASDAHGGADKHLIERVIWALKLLEGLARSKIDFVFKGGTAVMLLQGEPKRFSIDIDILVPQMFDPTVNFDLLATSQGFAGWEEHQRSSPSGIEKRHFKFFFRPVVENGTANSMVLLDVVVAASPYLKKVSRPISLPFTHQIGPPVLVDVPSAADLLGDKLTAFAPETTGIPYVKNGQSASLEIMKQLFDVARLFEETDDFTTVGTAFRRVATAELLYRDMEGTVDRVLENVVQTALCLSTQGQAGRGDYRELVEGASRLRAYVFSEKFQGEKAVVCAARAAYCAALIRTGRSGPQRYEGPEQVRDMAVEGPSAPRLKGLRKGNPEAYYYWHQTAGLWGGV
ncbi:MAG: nucleotidyl transferase AbiEii/AbiGii toxin family protein [Spirochaetales bacterium]